MKINTIIFTMIGRIINIMVSLLIAINAYQQGLLKIKGNPNEYKVRKQGRPSLRSSSHWCTPFRLQQQQQQEQQRNKSDAAQGNIEQQLVGRERLTVRTPEVASNADRRPARGVFLCLHALHSCKICVEFLFRANATFFSSYFTLSTQGGPETEAAA